jgi:hypothetical protein
MAMVLAALPGVLARSLPAQGVKVDWIPSTKQVTLNTEVTRILTSIGWVTVKGGIFVFRNVTIPAGTVVRGDGKNPLVFVIAGTFKLNGELTVRGGDGQVSDDLQTTKAHIPISGGKGVCGGGNGGRGSSQTTNRSYVGEAGHGPFGFPGFGGKGGLINCANPTCGIGSGGGGGSFATAGDPYYQIKTTTYFKQPLGFGAYGCRSRSSQALPGGRPGMVYFVDKDPGNNFFGVGFDVNRRRFVPGELPLLVGGSGGAGGGDFATSCASNDPNFIIDDRGGGGGAGGGIICVIAQGPILVGHSGRIDASGGNGGGGAWKGSSNRSGGGGAGAGGFLALYSRTRLEIFVNGETYAKADYDFPISADGGIGRLAMFGGGGVVTSKYPPTFAANMNARPSGGMGGLGIIQFMAPPGTTNSDGTNTYLDDNILLRVPGGQLSGANKQRYLAWRGFPDKTGKWVDDFGKATNIGDNAGDFRPTPILIPVF